MNDVIRMNDVIKTYVNTEYENALGLQLPLTVITISILP